MNDRNDEHPPGTKPGTGKGQDPLEQTRVSPDRQLPEAEVEPTRPSGDGHGFQIDDELEYDRERDQIQAMLFGTPVTTHRIGRFTILERLGQGAMGTVYAAYDEELDRKIAVKVLRKASAGTHGEARLLREAQAMAQLSHPNIVAVHEAGRHEGRVFVAMEFVRGVSLDRWFIGDEQEPRPWPEVIATLRQAGTGLAAAHRAGIVHRDFKPHNTMIGDDGVVRVLDFGLARQLSRSELDELPPAHADGPLASEEPSAKLTATGTVMGTPAYMAPEQFLGQPADARSDQFSFCAALYEGLYGQLPFAGQNFTTLFDNVKAGRIREPKGLTAGRVPAWIRRAVFQGLAVEPDQRHASMDALVELLGNDPARTRRAWLTSAALVLVAGVGGVGLSTALREQPEPQPDPCTEIAAGLDGVHDPERMDRARASVLATGLGYAEDTWTRLAARIGSYAIGWVEHSEDLCLAHHDGRLSTPLFDRATACMAERRAGLDTLIGVLEQADAGVVEQAAKASAALRPLAPCSDERWLAAAVPRPEDPERAAAVDREREALAEALILHNAGRSTEAQAALDASLERAVDLDDPALDAELELARGTLAQDNFATDEADAAFARALSGALAIDHVAVASEALARRLFVRGAMQRRLDEALVDADYGAALVERSPEPSPLRWLYFNNAAVLHSVRGETERADALYAKALAQLDGEASIDAAVTHSNQAQLAVMNQELERGIAAQREALALATEVYGPAHPMVANYLYILASMLSDTGAASESASLATRALDIRATNPNAFIRPETRLLAELANDRRDYAAARALAERGLATEGPADFFSIELRHALGDASIGLGETTRGLEIHREALAEAEAFYADSPAELLWSHLEIGGALLSAGEITAALDQSQLALRSIESDSDEPQPERVSALLFAAETELAAGQLEPAAAHIEQARATVDALALQRAPLVAELRLAEAALARAQTDPKAERAALRAAVELLAAHRDADDPELAEARFALAKVTLDDDAAQAQTLGEAARDSFVALGPAYAAEASTIERWLTDLQAGGEP